MDSASLLSQAQHVSFGTELKDQIPTINQHLINGIAFLNEFRDFCKERANIERDYAHRIEALVRKYQLKKEKKNAFNQGGPPISPIEPDFDLAIADGTTTSRAWRSILNETEALSKDRNQFSEALISRVYDPLKVPATKKDDARKKHIQFAQKLLSERDKSAQERDKAKSKYDASCEEVESSKQKQERAYDERNQEKLKRSYYQDILDMNNNKNSYVLALQVLNTHRKKYYEEDLPELSDNMQDLDESRIEGLKEIWESYIGLETKLTADAQTHLDTMVTTVRAIDASVDSTVFVRTNKVPWSAPVDQPFESSPTFNDTEELVVDDNARVFLTNKLMKLRRRQAQATVDISNRLKDLEGLQNLKEAYVSNSSLGDAEEVSENILETARSITLSQTMVALYDAEINTIVQAVGETGVQNQPHDFKAASFTIPTSCDYCQSTIWGIAKQGFTCRDCSYNCHSKCEMKVPPNCSNVKGGAKAQRNSITMAPAKINTMSSLPPELAPTATPISELSPQAPTVVKDSESNISLNQVQAHVIYDYEAASPGELSVNAGDIVIVIEGDDGSGWVTCQLNGLTPGLIPASYIEIEQFYEAPSEAVPIQKVQALYDYDAQSDLELTIREGDVIILTSTDCSEGWWEDNPLTSKMDPNRPQRAHSVQSPPTPPSIPQSTSSTSSSTSARTSRSGSNRPVTASQSTAHTDTEMAGNKHTTDQRTSGAQPSDRQPNRRTSSSSSSSNAHSHRRQPISTTFSLAPMTTTTVVTTTTTTSTEYPPLFFKPPPIPAHLDPKIFPLADTPTPPALKKFCFDLNGQPTFFRENQEGEHTMGQLEDALFNLSASAHQRALKSASEHQKSDSVQDDQKSNLHDQGNFSVTREIIHGKGHDRSTTTTITQKSVEHPQRGLANHPAWRSRERCRAKKRPASPITPVGSVDVTMPQSLSSSLHSSNASIGTIQKTTEHVDTSFLDRSSPPHKKSKRPWTNAPHIQGSDASFSKKLASSVSAPSFAEFATPALPNRSSIAERAREHHAHASRLSGIVDPSSLPSPSLSPTATSQGSSGPSSLATTDSIVTRRRFKTAPTSFHHSHEGDDHSAGAIDPLLDEEEAYMSDADEIDDGQDEMEVERSLQQAGIHHIPTLLDLPNLIATFDALPSSLQSYMLFHLLRRSPAPTLQFVSSVILATMKQDFLSLLPVELSRNILRFLDGRSLCKAAQVSKQWRVVVDSDAHIWMHQFQKEGFALEEREEEEAFIQRLGIDGHYGVRPNYQERKLQAKRRITKGKGRPSQTVVRPADLPESPLYPNDVTMLGEDDVETPLESTSAHKGSTNKGHGWDSDTAEEDGDSKEETFMTPDAAPPSPTTSHSGRFNDVDSEDELMEQDPIDEPFGPMPPSTEHPYKALFRRHWIIRQNWAHGRAKYIQFTGHSDRVVTCLQFDSEKIISGYDDQSIHVYDTVTGNRLKKLDGHEGGVWALQYRGNTLVSGATDRTVRVWDIERGVCTHTFRGHTSTVRCLQIVMPVNVNKDPHGVPKYEPEFPVIVTGSRDSTLLVWRLPDPELNGHIPPTDPSWLLHTLAGHSQSVRALAAEGSTLVSGSYDCTVRVWNICTGALVHQLRGHTQKVYSVVLDTERNQCMSGSMDAFVRIWSLEDGSCLHVLEGHTMLVGLLGLNANHLVSAAADCTVRIWDPARGVCLRVLAGHAAAITCFQHDGNKVISGSDGNLKMWNFKTGKFIRNLLTGLGSVWQVKFDERRCVAAVQRAGVNGANGATYFEVLDYGVYGIEEPLENAPPLRDESVEAGTARAGAAGAAGAGVGAGAVAGANGGANAAGDAPAAAAATAI
ncbi:SCF ubiquitin ligase complex subunit cdc4 [Mortierella sp. AM989]|nr:SCF ubiquitin ligase complex subunit cdc4 [Mortierella sp. AM989]